MERGRPGVHSGTLGNPPASLTAEQSKEARLSGQISPPHQRVLEVHEPAVIQREPALLKSLSLLRREEVTFVR